MVMRFSTLVLVAVGALSLAAGVTTAQPAAWMRLEGPHAAGLQTAAIASDGTLLAATWVTVLRNVGSGWVPVAGAVNGSIHDIGTAPGGRVWAGTSGALRSDDAGASWQWFSIRTAPHSGTHPSVLHVAQAPNGITYAGGFRTGNAGATWDQMTVYAFATAFVGGTAYAGTLDGVHRSVTGGSSWVPSGLQGLPVEHMASTGTRLLAATAAGILISDDGTTWIPTCTLPQVTGLAVAGDGSVWASAPSGLYRSPDGQTWPIEPTAFAGLSVDDVAANGGSLLAIAEGNPHRSTDLGATWQAVHDGLGMPRAAAAIAADGMVAVASARGGPFRSVDGGGSWLPWTDGLPGHGVQGMIVDAGAGRAVAHIGHGLHRASLDGSAWTPIPLPGGAEAAGVASDGAILLAVAAASPLEQHLFRSVDGGSTWTLALSDTDGMDAAIAGAAGVLVAGVVGLAAGPRIHVSVDGGITWDTRPHPTAPLFGPVPALFVDPSGRIYIGDGNRLQRSEDQGATWTVLGAAGSTGARLQSFHVDQDAICVGTTEGVWCSVDDGTSFAPASAGLPGGGSASVVALARDGGRYIALTSDDGVFASDAATANAPAPTVGALAVTVAPNPAEAATGVTVTTQAPADATLLLFDALGRRVALLHDGALPAGAHRFTLDAGALVPGAYLLRVVAGESVATRTLIVR